MKQFLTILFLLSVILSAFSQEKLSLTLASEDELLETILQQVEEKFNIKFSYPSEILTDKKISIKKKKWTLDQILFEISLTNDLQFTKIDKTYFYISKSQIQNLQEVLLTGFLTNGITKNKNASFKLSPKKMGMLAGLTETDVLESIQQLPGVISIDETATTLSVRGGFPDQNRVIWDGITIYHTGHLFGMVSVFNPNIAQKVSFYNKGTDSKYGDRISSVIDISTSKKIPSKTNFELGINGINTDVFIEIPIIKNKLGFQTSFRRSYEDIIETKTFKKFEKKAFQNTKIEEEFFYFKDYNLKFNYNLNKSSVLYFSLIHIDNDLENDFSEPETNTNYFDILDSENDGYSIQWQKKWNGKLSQETNLNLSKYRFDYNFTTKQNNNFVSKFTKENTITNLGLSTLINLNFKKGYTITFGYQNTLKKIAFSFKEQKNIVSILDSDNSKIDTQSLFSGLSINDNENYNLYIGARLNYYSELNTYRFEPRLIANKNLTKHIFIQLTAEVKNQAISQIDETILSDLSLERKVWRLADGENFPIINSYQITNGLSFYKNKWSIDFDVYYKKTKGITSLSLGFLNPNDNLFHKGEQKILGADFYIKKKINKNFQTWVSYSFLDVKNKYSDLNNNKYFSSNTEIKHSISASIYYQTKQFQVALGWKWRTGKPLTDLDYDEEGQPYFDGINTENLPNYHRLDLSATYNVFLSENKSSKLKVGFSIRNLYNNKSHISTEFTGNNAIDDPIQVIQNHSIGITPNFIIRLYL